MTVSVRNLLSDGTLKRFDGLKIRYESLRVKPGFNVRIEDDDFSASIDALAEHIYAGGDYPPLLVRFDSEGTPWIVDGHRRHAAIGQCISRGAPIEWVEIKKFDGNDVDALAATITTAEGRALTPLEMAGALKRLAAFGLTASEIARKVGKTPARVEQLLLLASANHDVHQAIKAGDVSASLASEIVRKHGEKAGEVIAAEKEKAKAVGKRKVTAGTLKRGLARISAPIAGQPRPPNESPATRDVLAERRRQIEAEGWTPEHDDGRTDDELALAGAWYATPEMMRNTLQINELSLWPEEWDRRWFKPGRRRRELVKAAALILAEIERIDREADHA